ncbi:MAG: 5'/3'-nucleotidase SurE [Firmicutes bacterium]|nr:5'/3'-nucleotidase SurE [Bacillota bacterium]
MNILIANDDGIEARGLRELARALHEEAGADIYLCAPDGQRSATGHGITVKDPIAIRQEEIPDVKIAYVISGLPADCIKVALSFLSQAGVHIDMVFSGINHGGNLGTDTLYSGTVSAALEGCLNGIPSVAVSVDSHHAEHFDYACELAVNAARSLWEQIQVGTANHRVVLNINVPNRPREEIRGLRYTRLGDRRYLELFIPLDEEGDARLPGEFRYTGDPVHYENLPPDVDVAANQDGYASITPIDTDLTCYGMIEKIKTWNLG